MNGILIGWGVDPKITNTFDEMIIAALLVARRSGWITYAKRSCRQHEKASATYTYQWDSLLLKRKVVHHLVHTIPGILVYALLPLAFIRERFVAFVSENMCCVYRVRFVIGDKWFILSVPRYV